MPGLVQHPVGLECLVGELEVAAVERAQLLLDALGDQRQQPVAQQRAVGLLGRGVELVALEQAQAHAGGLFAQRSSGRGRHRRDHLEHGQQRIQLGHWHGCEAGHCGLGCRDGLVDLPDIAGVARVAHGPSGQQRDAGQSEPGEQPDPRQFAPSLPGEPAAAEVLLGEHQFPQQALEEIAPAAAGQRWQEAVLETEGAAQAGHEAVYRAALLRAAREVDAAHHQLVVVARGLEHLGQQGQQRTTGGGELLVEAGDRTAPAQVGFGLQPCQQLALQALAQGVEHGAEGLDRVGWRRLAQGQRAAPDLLARCRVECGEELVEARDQVGLGHEHVDRQPHVEPAVEFLQPRAQRLRMEGGCAFGMAQQVGDADRQQHAVERLPRPVPAQQIEEAEPGLAVAVRVRVLGRVAACGIEQHGLVAEPPVAVARAAHARDLVPSQLPGQRKAQAGVDQRGRLAGSRRTDEHIPGQLVEVAFLAQRQQPGQPLVLLTEPALVQQLERLPEALAQQLDLGGFGLGLALAGQAAQQAGVVRAGAQAPVGQDQHGSGQQQRDRDPARAVRFEWHMPSEREQRSGEPDQQRQREQSERRDRGRMEQGAEVSFHAVGPVGWHGMKGSHRPGLA